MKRSIKYLIALLLLVYTDLTCFGGTVVPPPRIQQLEKGQPPASIHFTREVEKMHRLNFPSGKTAGSANLVYGGGRGGVGVETAPKIYIVFWGSQWINNDPAGEATILQNFVRGVGGSPWLNSVTQYCQGILKGTSDCTSSTQKAGNQAGMLAGVWFDTAVQAPSKPIQSQLSAEAVRAAQYFGNTSKQSNVNAQYIIATSKGNSMSGFGTQWCAWHSYAISTTMGNIPYTNLPYITDGGNACGANFNGLGPSAGITIVGGHEIAEVITDPLPPGGWTDSGGAENADKCSWSSLSTNIQLSTGTFPIQPLWSNATSTCVNN